MTPHATQCYRGPDSGFGLPAGLLRDGDALGYNGGQVISPHMSGAPTMEIRSGTKLPPRSSDLAEIAETALRALVSGIAGGDEADLARLYDSTAPRVYAAALRLTRDRSAAEEAVADTYWQVWREASRYDPLRGRVIAWLLIICRSRALDHIRRREPALCVADPHALADTQMNVLNEPLVAFFTGQRADALHAALQCLNATEQKLLGLAFFRGLSHQEIADEISMPLGTVKTVIRRAI